MYIRKAITDDVCRLMSIFEHAKDIMRASGNTEQWKEGYPNEKIVQQDVANGVCYVVCDDSDVIIATMAFIPGPDPTYNTIYEGEWCDNNPYYVIHRIAVIEPGMGIARRLLDWAFEKSDTIRIDTHRDNVIMQHILTNYGFTKCGIIYLANGDPRDAYMLTKRAK